MILIDFFIHLSQPQIPPMKCMLPILLMVTGFIYTKAQVTSHNPVTHISVIYPGKQFAGKALSDSTAVAHTETTGGKADSIRITDGTLSTDKLADDLLSSLHQSSGPKAKTVVSSKL